MRKLIVATKNPGKASEVAQILADLPCEVVSLAYFPDAPEVVETGSNFVDNAILKAVAYARFTGELVLADDSGLEVDALDGDCSIFSSRFAPTDPERISKLLELLKDVPETRRTARFRCAISHATPDGEVVTCEGKVEGTIAREPRGTNGFGYDPIFYLPERGKHMAELSSDEKNAISHRGKALESAKQLLLEMLK